MRTTLPALLAEIASKPDAALVFYAEGRAIRPEYHVTEIKLAHIRSVDCGRGEAEWDETLVQLLDGPGTTPIGGTYMSAGKFSKIARAALGLLGELTNGELFFEYAPGNAAARKLTVRSVEHREGVWVVQLDAVGAACKPLHRWRATGPINAGSACGDNAAIYPTGSSCCEQRSETSACCPS